MSKELEALQDLREVKGWNDAEFNKRLDIIETALLQLESIRNNYCVCEKDAIKKLRALEIIKNKDVAIFLIKRYKTVEEYNNAMDYISKNGVDEAEKLTQKEFDLLKEVLKCER